MDLTVKGIITNSIKLGVKNLASILGAIFLWAITIWIPYLNVGTTIGLICILIDISKGSVISPTAIFNSKYRQYMGEFFLLTSFIYLGIAIGSLFLIIPGIVISLSWSQAMFLMFDKEINVMEALTVSNKITKGNKLKMFFSILLLWIMLAVVLGILFAIFSLVSGTLAMIIMLIGYLFAISIMFCTQAHIYSVLSKKAV
ncbi:MAG TPA: hypothetical protein VKS21_04555 [Spirochaetota bacterium]|nr:hypothetical protein [Spirochaetota bacterium]